MNFRYADILPSLYKGVQDANGKFKIEDINDFGIIIGNIIQMLLTLGGVLAVIYIIWAGIQYIISSGDPKKTAEAKSGLTYAVVGLVLSAAAYLLVDFFAGRF